MLFVQDVIGRYGRSSRTDCVVLLIISNTCLRNNFAFYDRLEDVVIYLPVSAIFTMDSVVKTDRVPPRRLRQSE